MFMRSSSFITASLSSNRYRSCTLRRALVVTCGVSAVMIGVLALVGWGCDIEVFRSVLPGLPPILPVSALCFVLSGGALAGAFSGKTRAAVPYLSVAVFLISAKTLLHHLGYISNIHGADMPPNTAICFVLTSLSIVLLSLGRPTLLTVGVTLALTSLASIIAFGAALGIFSGLTAAYGWGTFAPMALNSAAAFLLLSLGIVILQWPEWKPVVDLEFSQRIVPLYSTLGAFLILSFAMLSVMIPLFAAVERRERESVLVEAKLVAVEVALGRWSLPKGRDGIFYLWKKGGAPPGSGWKHSLSLTEVVEKGPHLVSHGNVIVAITPVADTGDAVVYVIEKRNLLKWVNSHLLFSLLGSVIFTIAAISLLLRLLKPLTMAAFQVVEVLKENERELDRRVREATRELETSVAVNQRILEYSVDMICSFDRQGTFVQVSPACLEVLGYSQNELMGRSYLEFVYPEDKSLTEAEGSRIVAGMSTRDFRNRYVRKDGSVADLMWSACWSDEAQIMFCVARDITRMREVEDRLKESVAFAHSVLDSLTSTTAVLDESGTIVAVNNQWRSFARENGGDEACIGGVGLNYLESSRGAQGCAEALTSYNGIRSVLLGESEHFDLIYACDSPAEKRWFLLRAVPLPQRGAVVSHLDITKLKLSEISLQDLNQELEVRSSLLGYANSELMRTKNFLRAMIDHLPVAVFAKEGSKEKFGQFKLWNKMSEDLFGLSNEEVLGRTDYDFFPKDEADLFKAKDELTFQEGAPQRIEEEYISSLTRGKRALHTVKVPIFDNEGKPETLLGISLDITDRKRAEAEVETKAYQLEKASRYKSLFLANMSHEIRTPLTSIIGYTESLLDDEVPQAEEKEALRTIERNSRHLLGVINDILDFSKIEVGKLEFELVDIQLFELIKDVENLIRLQAEEKGIGFEVSLQYPLPSSIVTDPTRLKQILINLMGNAVKFTRRGRVAGVYLIRMISLSLR